MARGPRLIVSGVALHIVQRGHNRRECFRHDTDYLVYLSNLHELAIKTGCALHAYCLMTNHVHLLLTPSMPESCSLLMRNLGQRYVQYFNRRYQRSGTLWEGRFRSCLVDSAGYVIACHRYIERNPVRAGMVPSVEAYRWSSYSGNAGHAANALLTEHPEYVALAATRASRHQAYRDLCASGDEAAFLAAIREATHGGFALIGEQLRSALPTDQQPRLDRRPPGPRARPKEADQAQLCIELELGLRPRTS